MQTDQVSASVPSPFNENASNQIQFFVRLFFSGKTLVVQANPMDKVEVIHEKIRLITGISTSVQRLIYKGKQLQLDQTISDCGIEKESNLQLVGRLRSIEHSHAWELMNDLSSFIRSFWERNSCLVQWNKDHIEQMFMEFLKLIWHDSDQASKYLEIFISSSVPSDLVMLYMSSPLDNKTTADRCIRQFINSFASYPTPIYSKYVILLEFCKMLRKVGIEDDLYIFCRSNFGTILENIRTTRCKTEVMMFISLQDVYPFIGEIAAQLYNSLNSAIESTDLSLLYRLVHDFVAFMLPVRNIILLIENDNGEAPYYRETLECLHRSFHGLLEATLSTLGLFVTLTDLEDVRKVTQTLRWSLYVTVLKELNEISKLYTDLELVFWQNMRHIKATFCFLIVKLATKLQDFGWIFEHKEVTSFEVRRHLAMMMLPEVIENQEMYSMLIDRSNLLEKSFKFIGNASPENLRGRLVVKFKHEEAIGPGVLREWFLLVCQAMFNPQNDLFVACPNDRKRFFPNLASKVKPLHLKYFTFSGRMIAMALMRKVQIGIAFDRTFFLQLAGKDITLEDIKDADPPFYNSCKKILEMDPEMIDGDNLCLRFSCDVVSMGNRIEIELCRNGKDTVVDSKNREKYIHLLIQHHFVASLADQIQHFIKGFTDIARMSMQQFVFQPQSFFRCLSLEDLDLILDGSGNDISVEDWKAHTDYHGFRQSDRQISWFWKIVKCMSVEQRNVLLFFWTSIKFLPPNGFGGLSSRLQICKNSKPLSHLPSSQTCFNQLSFPAYRSKSIMQVRFDTITQEHIGCSFGNL